MTALTDVTVPDIGDFEGVEVVEVLVAVGDTLAKETPIVTLESDKASMEIPSPAAGVVREVCVKPGDKVSEGDLLLRMEAEAAESAPKDEPGAAPEPATRTAAETSTETAELHAEVLVLGAGPGGYTAAFRAADLGKKVVLVERYPDLGGVCLNVGCIPSKALLHQAQVIHEAAEMSAHGVNFAPPQIDLDAVRANKDGVIKRLTGGLAGLARQRKVTVVTGAGQFESDHVLSVEQDGQTRRISFDSAIIAAGSQPVKIPGFPDDPRLMGSTGALALAEVHLGVFKTVMYFSFLV